MRILVKESTIWKTVYSCTFFVKIKSNGSFHVSENALWLSLLTAVPGTFSFPESQCVFIPWTDFWTHVCKPKSNSFVNIFQLKHHTFFCKFHMVCTLQPPKIWWQTSVQAESIFLWLKHVSLYTSHILL